MDEGRLIAQGTETVLSARHQFLVIGLTGRTGSGCTTVSKLLQAQYRSLVLPLIHTPPRNHEDRKNRVVHHWLQRNWRPFERICVSDTIVAFALERGADEFLRELAQGVPVAGLASVADQMREAAVQAQEHAAFLRDPRRSGADAVGRAHEFYFRRLPGYAKALKDALGSDYTRVFQELGDNLRKSGSPFSPEPDGRSLFTIPSRILQLIELGKQNNQHRGISHDYFVIDALRHPYEILYLRERVPRFYAMAVSADADSRKSRLAALDYSKSEIDELDNKEYPQRNSGLKGYDKYTSQDIEACIAVSDIHVSNPGNWRSDPDTREIAGNCCRYVALMQHPGLVTPSPEERCMQTAYAARLNSGCISRQVGAVVTDASYSIKAVGWNDAPKGQVPCVLRYSSDLLNACADYAAFSAFELHDERFRAALQADELIARGVEEEKGRHITYCFKSVYNDATKEKNQVHTRALHGEENAILQVAKSGGQGLEGGYLFTTSSPCELCAKKAYQLGLSKVFYINPYPGISDDHVLGAGNCAPRLQLFSGVIGSAYHDLYAPMMPYKDELKILNPPEPEGQAQLQLGEALGAFE